MFNLKDALAGEPVKLRAGYKAYILSKLNDVSLSGYFVNEYGKENTILWTSDGREYYGLEGLDIIGIYDDNEPPILSIEDNKEYKEVLYFNKKLFVPAWTKVIAADRDGQIFAYSNKKLRADRNLGAWEQLESCSDNKFDYIGLCHFGRLKWYNSMVILP